MLFRKVLHQGGANHSAQPRTALLLQAIMPFGVKMETMETEETFTRLAAFAEARARDRWGTVMRNTEEETGAAAMAEERKLREKYGRLRSSVREKLHYRLHGPRFPRDMDAADIGEKNN